MVFLLLLFSSFYFYFEFKPHGLLFFFFFFFFAYQPVHVGSVLYQPFAAATWKNQIFQQLSKSISSVKRRGDETVPFLPFQLFKGELGTLCTYRKWWRRRSRRYHVKFMFKERIINVKRDLCQTSRTSSICLLSRILEALRTLLTTTANQNCF